jgi:hypothetical protein
VNLTHDLGSRNTQEIVVSLEKLGVGAQPLVAEVILIELVGLDHRSHPTIEDEVTLP